MLRGHQTGSNLAQPATPYITLMRTEAQASHRRVRVFLVYKRQMEIYQWLFLKNGFKVHPTGYFVYCNGISDAAGFNKRLDFEVKLIPYTGDTSWVEETILGMHRCLNSPKLPVIGQDCDFCKYREAVKGCET